MKIPTQEEIIFDLSQLDNVAQKLYSYKETCTVYTFTGPLGAGKTTLVKSLLSHFGVKEPITSPTFNYVNSYQNSSGEILYHFDLYRLKNIHEFLEAGFDEFLYRENSWSFIEWPEIIVPLLTHNACFITIDYYAETQRNMQYQLLP